MAGRGKAERTAGAGAGRRRLAAGDYVFLSFLTWGPMTAYDVKKMMEISVSNFWAAAHSQVYQQASRLLRDGYVQEKAVGGRRQKRLLSLTDKGRRAALNWLRQPAEGPQLYMESLVKLFFAPQAGDLHATRAVLEEERRKTVEVLAGYEEMYPTLSAQPQGRYPAMTLDLGIRIQRTVLAWIDDALAKLDEDLRAGATPSPAPRRSSRRAASPPTSGAPSP